MIMDGVEAQQAVARRLESTPDGKAAKAYVDAAIQAVWDLHDPEGKADRLLNDKGHITTGQCDACGTVVFCQITCEKCAASGARLPHGEAAA